MTIPHAYQITNSLKLVPGKVFIVGVLDSFTVTPWSMFVVAASVRACVEKQNISLVSTFVPHITIMKMSKNRGKLLQAGELLSVCVCVCVCVCE